MDVKEFWESWKGGCRDFSQENLLGIDFSYKVFRKVNFSWATFHDCICNGTDFTESKFDDAALPGTSCQNAIFRKASLRRANLRNCDFREADFCGANFYGCVLEKAKLERIVVDDTTRYFKMYCPEQGAFIGYKKCFNNRLVILYIPEDALRTSATMNSCRTNRAKVISIKSFDGKISYQEAQSLADENFIYSVGKWVQVLDFDQDRWKDSARGIHFWMTANEAEKY